MDRRTFLSNITFALFAAPLAVEAQPAGKLYRIGYLAGGSATVNPNFAEAFRQGLRELGWVEGQNIAIEYRFAEGRLDRLPDLAAQLVRLKVDIIVATPTPAAVAARNATRTIPIVVRGVGDPVGLGLVESLARPGGNITELSYTVGTETIGKGLELLMEAVPNVRRMAVLSNPANPIHARGVDSVKAVARSLGLQLQLLEARGLEGFDGAFAAMTRERAGALLVIADSMFDSHKAQLANLAVKSRLPYTNRAAISASGVTVS